MGSWRGLQVLFWMVLCFIGGQARAQTGAGVASGKVLPVAVKATPLFDGLVREDTLAAVRVQAVNRVPKDMSGALHFRHETFEGIAGTWTLPVELPKQGRKDWTFYYKPDWGSDQRLEMSGLLEPITVPFRVEQFGEDAVLIGVVGIDAQGVNSVHATSPGGVPGRKLMKSPMHESVERVVRVGLTELAALPDRPTGYRSLNWVVWPDADPSSLTPEQMDALLGWVADGGHLFMSVSDSWRQLMSSPIGDALPARLTALEDTENLNGFLRKFVRRAQSSAPVPFVTMEPKRVAGRKSWTLSKLEDGRAAHMVGTYGLGTVHLVPLSLRSDALRKHVPTELLWRHLLFLPPVNSSISLGQGKTGVQEHTMEGLRSKPVGEAQSLQVPLDLGNALRMTSFKDDMDSGNYMPSEQESVGRALTDIPGVAPLPLSWLFAFAIAYLTMIGPVDYFLLKKLNRQPWTWVTFPLYIAVFSSVAMVGTSLSKGSQAVLQRLEVVDQLPGSPWMRGVSRMGIFATGRSDVELNSGFHYGRVDQGIDDGGFMNQDTVIQGLGPGRLTWSTQTWTLAFADSDWLAKSEGRITVVPTSSDPENPGDGDWLVSNGMKVGLTDCRIFLGDSFIEVADLKPGEKRRVSLKNGKRSQVSLDDQYALYDGMENVDGLMNPWWASLAYSSQGELVFEDWAVFVGRASSPIEPIQIDGLSPAENAVTMIRAPFKVPEALRTTP